jgi:hypothetical protein
VLKQQTKQSVLDEFQMIEKNSSKKKKFFFSFCGASGVFIKKKKIGGNSLTCRRWKTMVCLPLLHVPISSCSASHFWKLPRLSDLKSACRQAAVNG